MSERPHPSTTALILAGGRAERMGGADKGLLDCGGRPLIERVLQRITPCVDAVLISANRNVDLYRRYGHPVIEDATADFAGPLAGIERGLEHCMGAWLWVVPCDAPQADCQLLRRLHEACRASGSGAAVPVADGRPQPTFALLHRSVQTALQDHLARGGRAARRWLASLPAVEVGCDDCPDWFINLNTPAELAAFGESTGRRSSAHEGR